MAPEFSLHVLVIGLRDRPGAVHSVAEVFSGRGLQMEAFFGTAGSQSPDDSAQALILFRAAAERADFVARVLRRLPAVLSVELLAPDDASLVHSVLVATPVSAGEGVSLATLSPGVALAAGTPAAMQAWLAGTAPRRLGALRLERAG
ncbi:hypothetical protein ACFONG_01050 [Uliginosibacterium paludis]|uniref:ACT domain-containing protein n=1 Tax=Uliginosibacterium paludis TaxID=1615952 RepID=A0ABV2CR07_9RHOO